MMDYDSSFDSVYFALFMDIYLIIYEERRKEEKCNKLPLLNKGHKKIGAKWNDDDEVDK